MSRKTIICPFWLNDACAFDAFHCRHAHGLHELTMRDGRPNLTFRTKTCFHWMRGTCRFGHVCLYRHGLDWTIP